MGQWFSKSKKNGGTGTGPSKVTEQDKAVLELKKQRDQIKQYQQRIQQALDKERELAKKLLREGKKDRAKLLLKKKRFQESQLNRAEDQLNTLETLTHDLEFAQIEVQVLEGLKNGNEALKKIHAVLTIDEIERILDETNEGIEKQKEIDGLLSNNLSPEDLEDVETEFEKIMAEENMTRSQLSPEELPEVPDVPLPDVTEAEKPIRNHERVALPAS